MKKDYMDELRKLAGYDEDGKYCLIMEKDALLRYGSDYNDKAFHQALLSIGPAPFSIIKQYLPSYYDSSDSNA